MGCTDLYRDNEDVRHFCGMLDGLALLPEDRVWEGMAYLKNHTPAGLEGLVDYFHATYVMGTFRRIQLRGAQPGVNPLPLRVRNIPPLFPIAIWNVHVATLEGRERTNNALGGMFLFFILDYRNFQARN